MHIQTLKRLPLLILFLLILAVLAPRGLVAALPSHLQNTPAASVHNDTQVISNRLLVKVAVPAQVRASSNGHTGLAKVDELFQTKQVKSFQPLAQPGSHSNKAAALFNWYQLILNGNSDHLTGRVTQTGVWDFPGAAGKNLSDIAAALRADPDVAVVEPDYIVSTQVVPDDPYYSTAGSWGQFYADMWGLKKINAEGAWDQATGSASIVIADIDTGVDRNHPDLQNNIWVNDREIPGNNLDDDNNGYVDDYYGWDWIGHDNDPLDDRGHGTHTAGTIAASGNNGLGIVGVNWTSKIMALKFLDSAGNGDTSDGIKALQYAADMGARVSSNSWGCNCNSAAMDDAVKYEHDRGMVVVTAAGNNSGDALSFSPTSTERAISVAASDTNDQKASFSNWGAKIDVIAPGVDILSAKSATNGICGSATVGTNYCRLSGTSMAAPHVAGLAALMLSKNPNLTNEEVRQLLRTASTDLGTAGFDTTFGFGRINATDTLTAATSQPLTSFIGSPGTRNTVNGTITVSGTANGPNFASYKLEAGVGHTPSSWATLTTSTTPVTNNTLATVDTTFLQENASYTFRLTVTDTTGKTYQFSIFDVLVDNFVGSITGPSNVDSVNPVATVTGTAQVTYPGGFNTYRLEWSDASSATATWSNAGINLANNGTAPVTNGSLGSWDTTALAAGKYYNLRLTIVAASGATYSTTYRSYKPVPADTTPPAVTITSPQASTYLRQTVVIGINASDNIAVNHVDISIDGAYVTTLGSAPYSFNWDTTSYANGNHNISATAYDNAGNFATSFIGVVVDNAAPAVSFTSPANGALVSGLVTVAATASDNTSVSRVEFYVDGTLLSVPAAPYSFSWDTTVYANNTIHGLQAVVYDAAGNQSSNQISVTVADKKAPTVNLTSPVNGSTVSRNTSITITATASDLSGISKVEFYANGSLVCTDATASYTCTWKVPATKSTSQYTLTAKAYDTAGNAGTSQVTVTAK